MRIAVAGKGGSGKTTIAGTLARILGRRGRRVVAVDGDTNPNLAQVLGMPQADAEEVASLPRDLLVRTKDESGTRTELACTVDEVLDRFAGVAGDRVRLLIMGRIDHAGAG